MGSRTRRRGIDLERFWTLLCGGSSDHGNWCIWEVSGLLALLIGGSWLLMMLAK